MKLAIGMPIADTVPGECFGYHIAAISQAVKLYGCGEGNAVYSITPSGVTPHDAARLQITNEALALGCDRLFFMDDDTITPLGGLSRLMEIMTVRKAAAVSGFYLKRGDPYTPVWAKMIDDEWFNVDSDNGVHEIHMTGLGCCLLDLKWLTTNVPKPWYRMKQDEERTIVTDDLVLFEAIRKAGGLILGDANVQCPHVGRREFIMRPTAESLRVTAAALKKTGFIKLADTPEMSPT